MIARLFAAFVVVFALSGAGARAAEPPRTIAWEELMPEGEEERLNELYMEQRKLLSAQGLEGEDPPAPQIGTFNVVEALDGASVRMPGFVLPFDYKPGGEISEFLLVPYFGACIHTPPPPPNQVVYVESDAPVVIEEMWAPVWVEGVMRTEKNLNGLGDAAYTLELTRVEPYD